jgi:hypothetical protein
MGESVKELTEAERRAAAAALAEYRAGQAKLEERRELLRRARLAAEARTAQSWGVLHKH